MWFRMVKLRVSVDSELCKQVRDMFPEATGLNTPPLVDWALRKLIDLKRQQLGLESNSQIDRGRVD